VSVPPIVGIDLGTTYCAVARLDERGRPVMVPNRDGEILTPSAVYLTTTGQSVVGQPALDLSLEEPHNTATFIKRWMGKPQYEREVSGRTFRPETLSAIILKKLMLDAERELGPIRDVVISVPAYFDDLRRKATQDAGRIAGLNVLDLIDEPSAAALAYTFPTNPGAETLSDDPRTVLVYDLGGGTFDVSLVKLGKRRFQVLAIEGDSMLGGKDWDDLVMGFAAAAFTREHGDDPRDDPQSNAMLRASAERAKRTLSKIEHARITVAHNGKKMQVPITRREFDELTAALLMRTKSCVHDVVEAADVPWSQVHKILMVGGSTHMTACAAMLRTLTGQEPDRSLAVSEVVARGAAVHAGIHVARTQKAAGELSAVGHLADIVEITVTAHSLGVEVRHGERRLNDRLILKNTQLPAAISRVYRTLKSNATKIRVRILQGEAADAAACIPAGECWADALPAGLPQAAPVQVRCSVGADGLVEVTALDMTSGKTARTELVRNSGLSDEEISREADYLRSLDIQ